MDVAAIAAQAAAAKPMPFTKPGIAPPGTVAHVDGDYCAYYCAGNDDMDAGSARRNLLSRLDKIKFVSGADSIVLHLTDRASKKGLRYFAATIKPYQGQRNSGRKPKNWEVLREYMEQYEGDKFRVKNWMEREADDGLAYAAHTAAAVGKLAVLVTADKDMRMLPGRHVVWKTNELVEVPFNAWEVIGCDGETYGHKWFWLQMLMGDTADNIPGLEAFIKPNGKEAKMGKATAYAQLTEATSNAEAYAVVAGLYCGFYGDEGYDRMAEQACLLWLRNDRHANLRNFMQVFPDVLKMQQAASRLQDRVNAAHTESMEMYATA